MGQLIVTSGNLGVGKTTLAKMLAERLGGSQFTESPPDYPYLEDMYGDMNRWCFNNQLSFMLKKTEEQLGIAASDRLGAQDRGVNETHEVFSRVFRSRGILDERDFSTLDRTFALIGPRLPRPAAIICMHGPTQMLIDRLSKRHRSIERKVWPALLDDLNDRYAQWHADMRQAMPAQSISLDMTEVDFVANAEQLDEICSKVQSMLRASTDG